MKKSYYNGYGLYREERKRMKNIEMVKKVKALLEPLGADWYFDEGYGLYRLLGCLYDEFVYKGEYKNRKPIYTPDQVIEATRQSLVYLKTKDFKLIDLKYGVNIIVKAIKRNLVFSYANTNINELSEILEVEM